MGRAIVAIAGSVAGIRNRPFAALSASIAGFCRQLARAMFDDYRPERHYMRGPGPACAAKRGTTQN